MPPFAVSALLLLGLLGAARAAVPADIVTSLPGFTPFPTNFKVYSGFLDVTFDPPVVGCSGACFYDGAKIHYQFHTSQSTNATADPVVAWHTGGPGGSSVYGQYAELGYFQVSTRWVQGRGYNRCRLGEYRGGVTTGVD